MPTLEFYGSADAVVDKTGVQHADLGLDSDEELETFLEGLLTELTDLLNRQMRRDYLAEYNAGSLSAIPPGLTGIATDVAADALRTMVATRQTPVVRIDDFAVTVLRARVFSEDVLRRLRLYGKHGLGSITLTNR